MNPIATVAILPECGLRNSALIMQAVLIAQSCSPMQQGGKYGMLIGWVVVGAGI
jgi:hypothetical protein